MTRRKLLITAALGAAALGHGLAFAQAYPSKPIKLIVGYAPGGSADITARLVADKLRTELGQSVIVENRPGAGGNIGTEVVAHAAPDGYTLLLAAAGQIVINPSMYKKLSFDVAKDLVPVTQIQTEHNLMVVTPSLPVKTVDELVAYGKANPDKLTFASPGGGSPAHLAGELLNQMTGIKARHVPYKGSAPALNDLMAGHVAMAIDNMPALLPQVRAGKLRALAVASSKRAAAAPDIPTAEEAGLNGYVVTAWKGLMAPAGTPPAVINRLHAAMVKVLAAPETKERMVAMGAEPVGSTPDQFGQLIKAETASWSALVKSTGAALE